MSRTGAKITLGLVCLDCKYWYSTLWWDGSGAVVLVKRKDENDSKILACDKDPRKRERKSEWRKREGRKRAK